MWRVLKPAVLAGCLLSLLGACFSQVLFRGQQFSYRDAGHFYYPLYKRVQQEWQAGRWPLWEPEENGGTPLLGNPTAAVLYPGKIVYALPYAWAARLYVIAHVLLACAGMLALLRSWNVSWTGASLGALAYGFGAPVLFQYCNIVFLVGAAWAPFGLRAVDRLLRLGRLLGLLELAAVLALQTLGGDPESAYLVMLCAGGYALALAYARRENSAGDRPAGSRRWRTLARVAGVALLVAVWIAATLLAAALLKARPQTRGMPGISDLRRFHQPLLVAAWGIGGLYFLLRFWQRPQTQALARSLAGLAAAAALGLGLSGAQLLPVLEFSSASLRAAEESPHDIFPFSLEPHRVVEWIWPGLYGSNLHGNHSWLHLVPPKHSLVTWVNSLYMGGLPFVLALAAAGFRKGPPWRAWLTAIAVLSFLGAVGEFGSPLWWARSIPDKRVVAALGAHDPDPHQPPRTDNGIADGSGSLYW
ncbi:MAG TPA: hypothetical protein VGY53_12585, partial [Isosphaeraceae bacterium]|nr:hypothetical protein [Isosphaeraceae bacterium]